MPRKISATPSKVVSSLQDLRENALELIGSKPDGIFQSELRKQLGIDSAKCSRVVSGLERSGLIKREPADYARRRTYLIRLNRDPLQNTSLPNVSTPEVSTPNDSPLCSIDVNRFANVNYCDDTYNNIDTYLTEFYLLYLIRGSSSA